MELRLSESELFQVTRRVLEFARFQASHSVSDADRTLLFLLHGERAFGRARAKSLRQMRVSEAALFRWRIEMFRFASDLFGVVDIVDPYDQPTEHRWYLTELGQAVASEVVIDLAASELRGREVRGTPVAPVSADEGIDGGGES
jgi:hypothetical protein